MAGRTVTRAAADAPHILRQPENAVGVGAGQVRLGHQPRHHDRIFLGQADGEHGVGYEAAEFLARDELAPRVPLSSEAPSGAVRDP